MIDSLGRKEFEAACNLAVEMYGRSLQRWEDLTHEERQGWEELAYEKEAKERD